MRTSKILESIEAETPMVEMGGLDEAKGKEVFLSMSDKVMMNTKHKDGVRLKIDSEIYDWAVKKFSGKGHYTATKKPVALSKQEIVITRPKGSTGSRKITVRPFGEYVIVRDDKGGAGKGKISYFQFKGKKMSEDEDRSFTEILAEAKGRSFADFQKKAMSDFLRSAIPQIKKIAGKKAERVGVVGTAVPLLKYEGQDTSDMDLTVTMSIALMGDFRVELMYWYDSAMTGKKEGAVRTKTGMLTTSTLVDTFRKAFV